MMLVRQCSVGSDAVFCVTCEDYKPVFANIPKAHDDARSSRHSSSDQYKSMSQPSYDRYYDSQWQTMAPPPRRDGKLLVSRLLCYCVYLNVSLSVSRGVS